MNERRVLEIEKQIRLLKREAEYMRKAGDLRGARMCLKEARKFSRQLSRMRLEESGTI